MMASRNCLWTFPLELSGGSVRGDCLERIWLYTWVAISGGECLGQIVRGNVFSLLILLCCVETWLLKKVTSHHRWLSKILHISWKDNRSDERAYTATEAKDAICERRLRCCGRRSSVVHATAVISCTLLVAKWRQIVSALTGRRRWNGISAE